MYKMKKLLLSIAAAAFLFAPAESNAQAIEKGTILIDAYYGFPNWTKSIMETTYTNAGSSSDIGISGIGPVGGRLEYMVGGKIGIGADVNFTGASINFKEADVDTSGAPVAYDYEYSESVIRAMVEFSWHFVGSDNFDAYLTFGVGYRNKTYAFQTNDPDGTSTSIEGINPLAMRLGVGGRYFFTDNIGAGVELGIGGGGNVRAGLAMKF